MLGALATPVESSRARSSEQAERALQPRRFGLDDVLALVGRFAVTDRRPIRLHVDTGPDPRISPEVASTAYRVLLEALTNVRRHAPAAAWVDVSITPCECETGPALALRVTNDAAGDGIPTPLQEAAGARHSNRGLVALAEAVDEIGGSFAAGALDPSGASGWNVTAVLPLRRVRRS
jgi:signal transduction histidine kinase